MTEPLLMEPIFQYILVKLSSRCNLRCTYCYWFRDPSVYRKPSLLTIEAEQAFLEKLETHIQTHNLEHFSILFHGGEPLLFGQQRFIKLAGALLAIGKRTGCEMRLSMTTNATLIDTRWAQILHLFNVRVTVSIDGPPSVHDQHRVDFKGKGTHEQVLHGLKILKEYEINLGVLAVCDPATDPETITGYFIDDLDLKHFDILIPDTNHQENPPSIANYYIRLFELWYGDYSKHGIDIRLIRAMVKGLLGGDGHIESIGYGPIQTLTLLTDGGLEPLDVLRIAGDSATKTLTNIFDHSFQDVTHDPVWRMALEASLNLNAACCNCEFRHACGGGYLPHRWSQEKGYDNPSVYCEDLKVIFSYMWERIIPEINVVIDHDRAIPLSVALQESGLKQ
jgi:uncharacterized protein